MIRIEITCGHCGQTTIVDGSHAIIRPVPLEDPLAPARDPRLAISIAELGLSCRAYNALANQNIDTVGDLLKCTRAGLLRLRNLGKVSLAEIDRKMAKLGLKES
jgi:DNA-directed RNA polymerase alpha subunit